MELLLLVTVILSWYMINTYAVPTKVSKVISRRQIKDHKEECSDVVLTDRNGTISSPNFPNTYPSHISCSWHIQGHEKDVINIIFDYLDIEESGMCEDIPCCTFNWIKISTSNVTQKKLCGHKTANYPSFISDSHKVTIKFHVSKFINGGAGFRFHFMVGSKYDFNCKSSDMRCSDNQCVPSDARCNGKRDCIDGSDEKFCSNFCLSGRSCREMLHCYDAEKHCDGVMDCSDYSDETDCGFCPPNMTQCGVGSTQCYTPVTEHCNRKLDCMNGQDENDCTTMCPKEIMCNSGISCYSLKERCDSISKCGDNSDEKKCGPDLCNYEHGGFLCNNGLCIREAWKCDHTNDCGDGSDESNCLRNSVLTAAVMGSLICALLLVVAISCTCRLHALRTLENTLMHRETPLSRLSRQFFFREPPPSYAVATGQHQRNLCVENMHYAAPSRRSHRRTRRPRRHRDRAPPRPPPAAVLDNLVNHSCILVGPDGLISVRPPEGIVSLPSQHVGQSGITLVAPVSTSAMRSTVQTCNHMETEKVQSQINESKDKSSGSEDEAHCTSQDSPQSEGELRPSQIDTNNQITRITCVQNPPTYYCDSDTEPLLT